MKGKYRDRGRARVKGKGKCTILHVSESMHTCTRVTHTHTLCSRVNRRKLHLNVPPFSFNRPLETVQRAFCWLTGEIRSEWREEGLGVCVFVCVCRGVLQRLAVPAFFL